MPVPSKARRRFLRFSLRAVLLLFAAASVVLAAMRYATSGWASAVVTLTVLSFLVSISMAVARRGERRLFWIAFALCGGGYLALVTSTIAPDLVLKLATTQSIAFLRDKFHPVSDYQSGIGFGGGAFQVAAQPWSNTAAWDDPDAPVPLLTAQQTPVYANGGNMVLPPFGDDYKAMADNFVLIGQCSWALTVGLIGALIARFVANRESGARPLAREALRAP